MSGRRNVKKQDCKVRAFSMISAMLFAVSMFSSFLYKAEASKQGEPVQEEQPQEVYEKATYGLTQWTKSFETENLVETVEEELNYSGQVKTETVVERATLNLANAESQEYHEEEEETIISEVVILLSDITTESSTEDYIRAAMYYFVNEQGFTPKGAAGILGNIAVESGFNPLAYNQSGHWTGTCQWNEYWWQDIVAWCKENGYDEYSFEGQIRAIVECPNDGCMNEYWWGKLKGMENIDQATELFTVFYEGCINTEGGGDPTEYYAKGSNYNGLNLRKSQAKVAYDVYVSMATIIKEPGHIMLNPAS